MSKCTFVFEIVLNIFALKSYKLLCTVVTVIILKCLNFISELRNISENQFGRKAESADKNGRPPKYKPLNTNQK